MSVSSHLRHDFINNGLRLEILNKLICEELEKKESINPEYLEDYLNFLKQQIEYTTQLKQE